MSKLVELRKRQNSITIPAWDLKQGSGGALTTVGAIQVKSCFHGAGGVVIEYVGHQGQGQRTPLYYYSSKDLATVGFDRQLFPDATMVVQEGSGELVGSMSSIRFDRQLFSDAARVVQEGSDVIMHRLKKFEGLQQGWDSYNAKAIDLPTRVRAIEFFSKLLLCFKKEDRQLIPIPFVSPVSDGSIQFEWKTCYKELIHSIPVDGDIFEYLKIEKLSMEEKEQEGVVFSLDDLVKVVADWLK